MKLRRLSEDFAVEELADFLAEGGRFALYRLRKRSLGTLEAVQAVARRWKLTRERISFGGLKDRHAVTEQFVTIERGPTRGLEQTNLSLAYLGQAARPFTSRDILGNRFRIVVRQVAAGDAAGMERAWQEVQTQGIPNYFDDQRFGSLGASGEFIARAWCLGDYQRAVWLALADDNPHDRPRERQNKQTLRARWGNWPACLEALRRSPLRPVLEHLSAQPQDFRGAIARIHPDQRSLYLAAYQAFLWNGLLASWLRARLPPEQLFDVELACGVVPFVRALSAVRRRDVAVDLPLPSARQKPAAGPIADIVEQLMAQQGLQLRELRVKYPRDSFFSKGSRPALVQPANLEWAAAEDELYPSHQKRCLAFDLPRGAYATIVIKTITRKEDGQL